MVKSKRVTLLVLGCLTLLLLSGTHFLFRIKQIECQLEQQPCPSEIASQFEQLYGNAIYFFDGSQIDSALQTTPTFYVARYQFKLPHTLHVSLRQQALAYTLTTMTKEKSLAVTTDGRITTTVPSTSQIVVEVPDAEWSKLSEETTVDVGLHTTLTTALRELTELNLPIYQLVLIDTQTLALYLPEKPTIILDATQISSSVARLKLVLAELEVNPMPTQVQEIDVRYKLPVLRTSPTIPRHTSD